MKTIKESIKNELRETEEMFNMGLLTPQERFKRDWESKQALKLVIRMTKN